MTLEIRSRDEPRWLVACAAQQQLPTRLLQRVRQLFEARRPVASSAVMFRSRRMTISGRLSTSSSTGRSLSVAPKRKGP